MHYLLAVGDPLDHVLPHSLHITVGPFNVNNQMLMAVVAAVLMLLIFPVMFTRARSDAPSGARNFFESILEFLRTEVFRPALKQHTDRFVPFLWTLFFFILFCNLLGQIPIAEIITLITGKQSHLGGTATGTAITTGALAICAFIFIHLSGVMQVARSLMEGTYGHHDHHEEHPDGEHAPHEIGQDDASHAADDPHRHAAHDQSVAHHHAGGFHQEHGKGMSSAMAIPLALPLYLWNFAPHPFKPQPGASRIGWVLDVPMWALLLALELIGAGIKPFALTIRLFANMIAGHIVLAALIMLIPMSAGIAAQIGIGIPITLLSLLIRVLELFVAFLQAYIFTFLTTLFIAAAVAPEH